MIQKPYENDSEMSSAIENWLLTDHDVRTLDVHRPQNKNKLNAHHRIDHSTLETDDKITTEIVVYKILRQPYQRQMLFIYFFFRRSTCYRRKYARVCVRWFS